MQLMRIPWSTFVIEKVEGAARARARAAASQLERRDEATASQAKRSHKLKTSGRNQRAQRGT